MNGADTTRRPRCVNVTVKVIVKSCGYPAPAKCCAAPSSSSSSVIIRKQLPPAYNLACIGRLARFWQVGSDTLFSISGLKRSRDRLVSHGVALACPQAVNFTALPMAYAPGESTFSSSPIPFACPFTLPSFPQSQRLRLTPDVAFSGAHGLPLASASASISACSCNLHDTGTI
jgi:hypothetical protein